MGKVTPVHGCEKWILSINWKELSLINIFIRFDVSTNIYDILFFWLRKKILGEVSGRCRTIFIRQRLSN